MKARRKEKMSKQSTSSSSSLGAETAALSERVINVEDTFYDIATKYSRLPWSARTNPHIAKEFRRTLFELFSEVDGDAHARFFEGALQQAKFVVDSLTDLDCFVKENRALVRRVGELEYAPVDVWAARCSIGVAGEALVVVEKKSCVLMGDLRIVREGGREDDSEKTFLRQSPEDMERCLRAVRKLLRTLPKTREQLKLGKGVEEVCSAFLGIAEMARGKQEESESEKENESKENLARSVVEVVKKDLEWDRDSGIWIEKMEPDSNCSPKIH